METIKKWAQTRYLRVVALPVFRQDFPTMAFLYAITTGVSLAMGLGCLLGPGTAAAWERRGVDRAVQRRWSRVQGVLFLANAAICRRAGCWRGSWPLTRTSSCWPSTSAS